MMLSTSTCASLPTKTVAASDGRDGFKLFNINHSSFKQLIFDPFKLPELNDDWFLDTIISKRSSSRHTWGQSLWLTYL